MQVLALAVESKRESSEDAKAVSAADQKYQPCVVLSKVLEKYSWPKHCQHDVLSGSKAGEQSSVDYSWVSLESIARSSKLIEKELDLSRLPEKIQECLGLALSDTFKTTISVKEKFDLLALAMTIKGVVLSATVFAKPQVGSSREIIILEKAIRILVKVVEEMARAILELYPNSMSVQAGKDRALSLQIGILLEKVKQDMIGAHDSDLITYTASADTAKWSPHWTAIKNLALTQCHFPRP
eukprot:543833-Amphidinium_carterae.2